jgi:hypothetical protein
MLNEWYKFRNGVLFVSSTLEIQSLQQEIQLNPLHRNHQPPTPKMPDEHVETIEVNEVSYHIITIPREQS